MVAGAALVEVLEDACFLCFLCPGLVAAGAPGVVTEVGFPAFAVSPVLDCSGTPLVEVDIVAGPGGADSWVLESFDSSEPGAALVVVSALR